MKFLWQRWSIQYSVLTQAHLSLKLMVSHYAPIHNDLHKQEENSKHYSFPHVVAKVQRSCHEWHSLFLMSHRP
jgi:hypothetical protein